MASPRDADRSDAPLSGDAVAAKEFTQSRRGYDPDEVRRYLKAVGRELGALHDRAAELDRRLVEQQTGGATPELTEEVIVNAVGQEMADSLRSAHAAATELRRRAADEAETRLAESRQQAETQIADAERRLSEATEEAQKLRAAAEEETARAKDEATKAASEQLRAATEEAAQLRLSAQDDAKRIREEAEAEAKRRVQEITSEADQAAAAVKRDATSEAQQTIGKARAEAEVIRQETENERSEKVASAQTLRDQILGDLARKRRLASIQIEQLRAGRDRLNESYAVVRRTLDEVTEELDRAETEARSAADQVGKRLEADPDFGNLSDVIDDGPPTQAIPVVDAPRASESKGDSGKDSSPSDASATPAEGAASPSPVASSGPVTPPGGTERVRVVSVGAAPARAAAKGSVGHLRVVTGTSAVAVEHEHPSAGIEETPAAGLELVKDAEPAEEPAAEAEKAAEKAEAVEADQPAEEVATAAQEVEPEEVKVEKPKTRRAGKARAPRGKDDAVGNLFDRIRSGRTSSADESETKAEEAEPAGKPAPEAEVETAEAATDEGEAGEEPDESAHSDEDEALLQRRELVLGELERTLTHRLKRTLQDEQNDLLDRLRGVKGTPTAERVLLSFDDQVRPYREAVQAALEKALVAGYEFATELLGTSGGTPDAETSEALTDAAVGRVVEPLRRRIEEIFAEDADGGFEALTDSLGSVYRSTRNQRVERVAGDVLASGFAAGTWQATPEGASLRWIAEDADGPCPDCDDNALAGDQPRGEAFPTGQPYPPAHDGCRCLIVPTPA